MNEDLFRKKSLDKIKSPENLNDYIRVLNPRIFALIVCALIIIAGACVWGFFGTAESTVPADIHVKNGEAVCYVDSIRVDSITTGMIVRVANTKAVISAVSEDGKLGYICRISPVDNLEDGVYEGVLVTKKVKPISLVFD